MARTTWPGTSRSGVWNEVTAGQRTSSAAPSTKRTTCSATGRAADVRATCRLRVPVHATADRASIRSCCAHRVDEPGRCRDQAGRRRGLRSVSTSVRLRRGAARQPSRRDRARTTLIGAASVSRSRVPYSDERIRFTVFVPKDYQQPYQALVYFPGCRCRHASIEPGDVDADDRIPPRSGRMVVAYPVYQQTYERRVSGQQGPGFLRRISIERGQDVRRVVDYLSRGPTSIGRGSRSTASVSGLSSHPCISRSSPGFERGSCCQAGLRRGPSRRKPIR